MTIQSVGPACKEQHGEHIVGILRLTDDIGADRLGTVPMLAMRQRLEYPERALAGGVQNIGGTLIPDQRFTQTIAPLRRGPRRPARFSESLADHSLMDCGMLTDVERC